LLFSLHEMHGYVFSTGDCAVNLSRCRSVLRDFDFSFDFDIFFRLLRAVHFIIAPLRDFDFSFDYDIFLIVASRAFYHCAAWAIWK